jgi:predicted transcriptional regulator
MPEIWHLLGEFADSIVHRHIAMKRPGETDLSKREREALDALYRLGRATAAEIRGEMSSPPTYTAVRTHLTNLEKKGFVRYESDGVRYTYEPTVPRDEMGTAVMKSVLQTFFDGRIELVVSTLLRSKDRRLDREELKRLTELIEEAQKEGK